MRGDSGLRLFATKQTSSDAYLSSDKVKKVRKVKETTTVKVPKKLKISPVSKDEEIDIDGPESLTDKTVEVKKKRKSSSTKSKKSGDSADVSCVDGDKIKKRKKKQLVK